MTTTTQQAAGTDTVDGAPVVRVTTQRVTYLGRRAIVRTLHTEARGRHGLREVRTQWLDDATPDNGGWAAGSVVSQTIKGDGRARNGFQVLIPHHLIASL